MTELNNYTLIAIKPESYDMCSGCLMETYGGDVEVLYPDTEQELIEAIGRFEGMVLKPQEEGYRLTILLNGRPPGNELVCRLLGEGECLGDEIYKKEKQRLADEDAVREAERASKKEAADRKLLAELQERYGDAK